MHVYTFTNLVNFVRSRHVSKPCAFSRIVAVIKARSRRRPIAVVNRFFLEIFSKHLLILIRTIVCQRVYVFLSVTEEQYAYKQMHARQRDKVFVTTFVLFD